MKTYTRLDVKDQKGNVNRRVYTKIEGMNSWKTDAIADAARHVFSIEKQRISINGDTLVVDYTVI